MLDSVSTSLASFSSSSNLWLTELNELFIALDGQTDTASHNTANRSPVLDSRISSSLVPQIATIFLSSLAACTIQAVQSSFSKTLQGIV